jgi:metal-responsive CopG/Arc/MetJ family transcriptional regulator
MSEKEEKEEKGEFQRFSVSLPMDLFNQFEDFRNKTNTSRSDAIRKAMREYITKGMKEQKRLGSETGTAVIIIYMEHAWQGHDHSHEKISTEEHSHEHSHDNTTKLESASYFSYPDTDLIKINHLEHIFHDIIINETHLHCEHDKCLIIIPVKGPGDRIEEFYQKIIPHKSILSHYLIIEN